MPEYSLHWIDLLIIALYAILVIQYGFKVGRKHDNAEEYFLAGRSMTWPLVGISLFASNISSTTLVGLAGDAYSTGISVFNYEWMAAVVLVFFAIFLLPLFLRSRIYTVPEFLEKRFDKRSRKIFSVLTLFLNIMVDTAGSLYAGGLLLKMIFPEVPLWQTITILAVLGGAYTIAGGLAAVMHTDAVQAVLLLTGSVIMSVAALLQVGSWESVMQATPPEMLSLVRPLDDPGVPWLGLLTGVPLLGFYFWCTNQFMAQRFLSAKNIHHGRLGALLAGLLKLPVLFLMVLPGTMARLLYPDLANPDMVYATLMFDLLPVGVLGIVIAGFIAALMSQIDSTLNSASTLLTMDFVAGWRPDLSGRQLMWIGRGFTALFMILAAFWAPQIINFESLFKYLQKVLSYAVPPVVALFLIGIFWKRASAAGAFITLVAGLIFGIIFFIINEILNWTDIHFLYVAMISFAFGVLMLWLGSLLTQPPDSNEISPFLWKKEVVQETTAALPWYLNYRYLSVLLLMCTTLILVAFW